MSLSNSVTRLHGNERTICDRPHYLGLLGPDFLAEALPHPGDGVFAPALGVAAAFEAVEGVPPGVEGEGHRASPPAHSGSAGRSNPAAIGHPVGEAPPIAPKDPVERAWASCSRVLFRPVT